MATWNVTHDSCCDATPIGATTTRGQLGVLAAGATIARCGGDSAMQRVMGRGHATSFVQLLWSDWIRPTIRRFELQVPGYSGTSAGSRSHSVTTLWFAASPLLLSVSTGPSHTPSVGRLADSRRVVEGVMTLDGGFYVAVRDVHTGASTVVMHVWNGATIFAVDVEQTYNSRSLAVLSTTTCAFPTGHSLVSLVVMRNWDRSSGRYGSRTFIAKTLRRARNRRVHEVFHVEESTGTSRPLGFHDDEVNEVFRLSDSVFCVSFCTSNNQEVSFKLFHRDNVEQPLKLLPREKLNNRKEDDSMFHHVTVASGFIFKSFTSRIEVVEPVSGLIILTINFPRLTSLNLIRPLSFFL
ncbi:hypothetical protein Pelo_15552 [Pelomyxa schiedti]|nr:hypothetical protein Pelo_15552 [Pelomyxa schiedti]